jgi:broad specificity phosphatase PhoE
MDEQLPVIYLARHGETEWSAAGRHTGLTDLPLTARGEANACRLGGRLRGRSFVRVFTSPLQRASRTCELAGFGAAATADRDLVEWNYGAYEGKTSAEIHEGRPGWEIFRDGCPEGESAAQVAARADRVADRLRALNADALVFSHGHFLRVLAARWLGLDAGTGRGLYLGTASLSILGYEHGLDDPAIRLWNDDRHVAD